MGTPVQVTFRDVPATHEIERLCLHEAQKLERYHPRITGCHVQIDQLHWRRHEGNLYGVRVNVHVPGGEVLVNRTPSEQAGDEKLELAIREAFDTARRRLEDSVPPPGRGQAT